jgi:nicotinate-nucleotide--dimethylbenzimidazole phosphoribosyltransferase
MRLSASSPVVALQTALTSAITAIGPLDGAAMAQAGARQDQLTKPHGSLGRLEELVVWVAGVTGCPTPVLRRKVIVTAAADHGVARHGVSAYPPEVTAQMVRNFLAGGAAVNVLSRQVGARVLVVDAGVAADLEPARGLLVCRAGPGTADFSLGPAMSRQQALYCLVSGLRVACAKARRGSGALATGDMGIGNTTAGAAVIAALTGRQPREVVGRGTGVDNATWRRKVRLVERALEVNGPDPADALDVLTKVGGFELGFLAGAMLGAASRRWPVVLDGLASGASALLASRLAPQACDYMMAAHLSPEPGLRVALEHLGLTPLLDLKMRLGEGTGAALGLFLLDTACRLHREMATFASASVSQRYVSISS